MQFKKIFSIILAFVLVISLCACGKTVNETETTTKDNTITTQTVTDMVGRQVVIKPNSYKRVVCIGAGALRLYSYIGDISLLSGVEDIDNTSLENRPKMFDAVARPYMLAFGENFKSLPSCGVGGPKAQTAEAEKILSCTPDIVISEYEDADKANALSTQLGVPVITLKTGKDGVFDEAFSKSLELLGVVFGREARAKELINFVNTEVKKITDITKNIPDGDKPSVYICGLGNWGTTNHLMTAQNYKSFQIANVNNAVSGLAKDGIQPIEKEKFESIGKDIDIMIIDAAAIKNIKPLYKEDNKIFNSCKAYKDGEVYLQLAYNAYYTNYETSLINTWFIAKTAYPDLFKDVDIKEKANEITKAFLGKGLADEMFSAPSSFGGYGKIDVNTLFK